MELYFCWVLGFGGYIDRESGINCRGKIIVDDVIFWKCVKLVLSFVFLVVYSFRRKKCVYIIYIFIFLLI